MDSRTILRYLKHTSNDIGLLLGPVLHLVRPPWEFREVQATAMLRDADLGHDAQAGIALEA